MRTTIDQLCHDIWHYVFEYFNTTELFLSFVNITPVANEVLFNDKSNFYFRGLRLDSFVETLPEKLSFYRIRSLELHQGTTLDVIRKCSALRSLKLIGVSEWIISLLIQISSENMQLECLIIVVSGIGPLQTILRLAGSMWSLRQLKVFVDEIEESIQMNNLLMNETRIESFTLCSSSSVHWNDLLNMLPVLSNIHFLDVTLFQESKNYLLPFKFWKLRHIRLLLLEISFYSLIQLVTTTPSLIKLNLTGLINAEGYVVDHQWIRLFDFCPSIDVVRVDLSLEKGVDTFRDKSILVPLYEINLRLICLDDECDYYGNELNHERWWKLSGILKKHHLLGK